MAEVDITTSTETKVITDNATQPPPVTSSSTASTTSTTTVAASVSGNKDRSAEIATPRHEAIIRRNKDARAQQQAQHTAVISLTVRNTNKILKEIGFRRARLRVSQFILILFNNNGCIQIYYFLFFLTHLA